MRTTAQFLNVQKLMQIPWKNYNKVHDLEHYL